MTSDPDFTVNGRYLTQSPTGVQRYAANVVEAMDRAVADRSLTGTVIAPKGARIPDLSQLKLQQAGPLSGHLWEQIVLPARSQGILLNLCNTGPAIRHDQIVCIHDANIFAAPDSYSRSFGMLYRTLQPLLARRAARIATVSHAAARQIARYLPVNLDDVAVLPNGHEHALRWNPALAQQAVGIVEEIRGSGRRFVMALGSRARHKNIRLLERIAPALDSLGIDIVVAGGGSGIFPDETLQNRSNLKLVGHVSDDDLACLFKHALCLTFPSLTEGFGLPIVEAMAWGCPVIAANCASMPEVCGNAALLASPNDPEAWVDHIRTLASSPALGTDLAGRGFEQIKHFSWSRTAAGYLDLTQDPASRLATARPAESAPLRTVVAIATRGRPSVVAATVRHLLATQTLAPDAVIVSCVDPSDAGDLTALPDVRIVTGPPGLAAQRNTALSHLPGTTDIVVFFDDDFIADRNWLAAAAQVFRDESQVVCLTGHVVADGIKGPGLSMAEALRLIDTAVPADWTWVEPFSPDGCNMAFRREAIGNTRFDERLVLYGWLEDRDFGAALAKHGGRFIKCATAFGVHMGTKSGRVSGDRLGYSQIANPIYMLRKKTMTSTEVAGQIFRNMVSNYGLLFKPEPYVDRRGRARGNFIDITDIFRGRLEPERAAALQPAGSKSAKPEATTR